MWRRLHDSTRLERAPASTLRLVLYQRMDKSGYEIEQVLAARGPNEHRFDLLKYSGPEFNKWSPDQWCACSDKIIEFCRAQGLAIEDMVRKGPNPLLGGEHGHCHKCI